MPLGTSGYLTGVRAIIKEGSTEEQVIEFLGEPYSKMVSVTNAGHYGFIYSIKNQPPGHEFHVSFDPNGKVQSIRPLE